MGSNRSMGSIATSPAAEPVRADLPYHRINPSETPGKAIGVLAWRS